MGFGFGGFNLGHGDYYSMITYILGLYWDS